MEISEVSDGTHKFQKERFAQYGDKLTSELIFMHLVEEISEISRQPFNKKSFNPYWTCSFSQKITTRT